MYGLRCFSFLVFVSILQVTLQASDVSSSQRSCLKHVKKCGNKPTTKDDKIVVCYFTDWAWYRKSPANFRPENINATLCTHINYAFTFLNITTLTMVSSDPWADIDNKFFEKVVAYKKQGLKVLCSVGGWTNSAADHWSRMMSTKSSRQVFIDSVVAFLKKYGFDGLDVDYEYPGCPLGNTADALPGDNSNFNCLMSELKEKFDGKYLLTMATAAGKDKINKCYDMVPLFKIVDWINVMTYEYHSYNDGETGAIAPLCGTNSSDWGVYETIIYYLKNLGCPANKLVLGIPFYGASYTLTTDSTTTPKFGTPVKAAGKPGPYTAAAATISYMEICQYINENGYNVGYDKTNNDFAWKGDQFISFDGVATIAKKACFINRFRLRGAMFWTLDYDDFNNVCKFGSYPLLNTLNYHLGRTDTSVNGY